MKNFEKTKLKISLIIAKAQLLAITSANSGYDFFHLPKQGKDEVAQALKEIEENLLLLTNK